MERGPLAWTAFGPNPPTVKIHNTGTDGKANPGARIFVAGMQSFENSKNLMRIRRIEPDSVVFNREAAFVSVLIAVQPHYRQHAFARFCSTS